MSRRLSQRISEGDGIAIIARVGDVAAARSAEQQGAKALAVAAPVDGIRSASALPILWFAGDEPVDCDAVALRPDDHAAPAGAEVVVDVRDKDELEQVLETVDPEIFLLSHRGAEEDEDPLEAVLDLLAALPAGKLAIADVPDVTRDEVLELERAGVDAVLVAPGAVAALVGHGSVEV